MFAEQKSQSKKSPEKRSHGTNIDGPLILEDIRPSGWFWYILKFLFLANMVYTSIQVDPCYCFLRDRKC